MQKPTNTYQRLLKMTAITFVLWYLSVTIPSLVDMLNLLFGVDLSMREFSDVLASNLFYIFSLTHIVMIPLAVVVYRIERPHHKKFAWVAALSIVFMTKLGIIGYILYKLMRLLARPAATIHAEKELSGYIVKLALFALVTSFVASVGINILQTMSWTGGLQDVPYRTFALVVFKGSFHLIAMIPLGLLVKNYEHSQGRTGWSYFVIILFGGYLGLLTYLVFAMLERIGLRPAQAA